MSPLPLPWLALLILLPLAGGFTLRREGDPGRVRRLGVLTAAACLALTLWLAAQVFAAPEQVLVDPWRAALLGQPRPVLGVDALSAPLLVLVAALTLSLVAAAPWAGEAAGRAATVLFTTAGLFTLFLAQDLGVLTLAWAGSLLPSWRHLPPGRARRVFATYQLAGAALLALAVATIGWAEARGGNPAPWHLATLHADLSSSPLVLGALLTAVLLRKGLVPVHSWLPALFQGGHPEVAALVVAPGVGAYVLVRLLVKAFPTAFLPALDFVAGLAIATALYGALLGLVQRDLRRVLGFLAVSQSALILTGFESHHPAGVTGALLLWKSVGLALAALALVVAALEARFGPLDLSQELGLAARVPRLGALFLLCGLASIGIPPSLSFVSEDLLFHGVLEEYPLLGLGIVLASGLNGFVILRAYFRTFQGPAGQLPRVADARPREAVTLVAILLALLLLGLRPAGLVRLEGATGAALAAAISAGS